MYGAKYVWFFIGWYEDDWFQKHLEDENINCTVAQMEEAAEAHFTTEALQWNQDKSPTISGKVNHNRHLGTSEAGKKCQMFINVDQK